MEPRLNSQFFVSRPCQVHKLSLIFVTILECGPFAVFKISQKYASVIFALNSEKGYCCLRKTRYLLCFIAAF